MALTVCKNHPAREAIGHCETCHIPLCDKCAVTVPDSKSIYCSKEHAEKAAAFSERRKDMNIRAKKNRSIVVMVPIWIVSTAILAAIVMTAVYFVMGMSPYEQIEFVRGLVGM